MLQHEENQKAGQNNEMRSGQAFGFEIDEAGLTGLSALLTFPPSIPFIENMPANAGERRAGHDRRVSDRRKTARELSASE